MTVQGMQQPFRDQRSRKVNIGASIQAQSSPHTQPFLTGPVTGFETEETELFVEAGIATFSICFSANLGGFEKLDDTKLVAVLC